MSQEDAITLVELFIDCHQHFGELLFVLIAPSLLPTLYEIVFIFREVKQEPGRKTEGLDGTMSIARICSDCSRLFRTHNKHSKYFVSF